MAIDPRPLLVRGKLGLMTSRPRSLPLMAVAGALVTSLAGCSAIGSASGIHPGGDPEGQVLHSLEAATKVLPSGIQVIRATNLEATWSDACPSNPYGKSGWGPVLSGSWFNSQTNQATLVSEFNAIVGAQEWRQVIPKDDSAWQFIPVAEWTKQIPGANLRSSGSNLNPKPVHPGIGYSRGSPRFPDTRCRAADGQSSTYSAGLSSPSFRCDLGHVPPDRCPTPPPSPSGGY